ncbi:hypothetical protein AWM79_22725 [Pseudomonas agarici]|uniref:Uncharacterized protein n=1 Tax=Pseudomonas agarici TaxID=46677 RepID=A0A0X1T756_PSEAA|nr:hypothetical protein AWM79_22725 [Pseudomonas agarici]
MEIRSSTLKKILASTEALRQILVVQVAKVDAAGVVAVVVVVGVTAVAEEVEVQGATRLPAMTDIN